MRREYVRDTVSLQVQYQEVSGDAHARDAWPPQTDSGDTPQFLGTGKRFNTVTRGT